MTEPNKRDRRLARLPASPDAPGGDVTVDRSGPSASASNYRPSGTLTVRTEIRRQLNRRRTWFAFGLLALLPPLLVAAILLGPAGEAMSGGFFGMATVGWANFVAFVASVAQTFLLPVIVALLYGDTVASEASWGSLRYLLAIPIPRGRLLGVKLVVSLLSSLLGILVLLGSAAIVGAAAFGVGTMRTPGGMEFTGGQTMQRVLLLAAYLAVIMLAVGALAFWLSVNTDAPLAAVGGSVLLVVVSGILDQIRSLGDLRRVLPTHYFDAWHGLFSTPIQLIDMLQGTFVSLVYTVIFLVIAWLCFQRKDILS